MDERFQRGPVDSTKVDEERDRVGDIEPCHTVRATGGEEVAIVREEIDPLARRESEELGIGVAERVEFVADSLQKAFMGPPVETDPAFPHTRPERVAAMSGRRFVELVTDTPRYEDRAEAFEKVQRTRRPESQ